jgi:N-acetylglucosaminyl-diphospho-decaprenol L-rhamnosyltransferase
MDDVRIQVVNYKTKAYLVTCLRSVFADLNGSDIKFTVAVLDNASGDDLADPPRMFSGQQIEVCVNQKNVGFGAGHNILAKGASAQYLLLLNPDIEIIEPNTIGRLLRRAKESSAEVVGPRLVTTEKYIPQQYDHGELYGFRAWIAQNTGHAFWKERKDIARAAWVSGAVFLIERTWFERLGGFDENFFLYGEELELCFRLRALGGNVVYDPTITVFHHAGVVAKKSDHLRRSNNYFLQKHFRRRWSYPLLRWMNNFL